MNDNPGSSKKKQLTQLISRSPTSQFKSVGYFLKKKKKEKAQANNRSEAQASDGKARRR